MDGSPVIFLDDSMEIVNSMDVDNPFEMESIKVDDPMDVDPPAFAISVIVKNNFICPRKSYGYDETFLQSLAKCIVLDTSDRRSGTNLFKKPNIKRCEI